MRGILILAVAATSALVPITSFGEGVSGVAQAQAACIRMPWDPADHCARQQGVVVDPAPPVRAPAPAEGQPACIKMPWHTVDPCAGQQRANINPAPPPAPAPAQGGCTEIKMPWHTVDPCVGQKIANVDPAPGPAPAPLPTPEPARGAYDFKVGETVEFDKMSNERWGSFGRIVKRISGPGAPCPWYFIEEAGSGITANYVCHRIRSATQGQLDQQVAANQPKLPGGAPRLGHYFCTYGLNRGQVFGPGREFWLEANGRYRDGDGDSGTYSYDATAAKLTFRGGFFGRMNAWGQFIGGRLSQIDINPKDGVLTYCSIQ